MKQAQQLARGLSQTRNSRRSDDDISDLRFAVAASRDTYDPEQGTMVTRSPANPLVEAAYANLRLDGLAHRPEAAGADRLMAHNPRMPATINGYVQKFKLFQDYCLQANENCWAFSVELAFLFSAYMATRISRTGRPVQSIRTYFSALNYFYTKERLGAPWQQGPIKDLNNMFESASKVWRQERGFRVGNLRTEVSGAGIAVVIEQAVRAMQESKQQPDWHHPAHQQVAWLAVFLVMLIFWFQADTIAGYQPGDISFNDLGAMNFVVQRLKRGQAHVQPFSKSIPAPTTGRLQQIFAVIRYSVSLKTATGDYIFSSSLWGADPKAVSDKISSAMSEILDYGQLFIPDGSFISSHSWRRTGASAFAACRGDWHLLMRWGMWRAIASAQAYVNLDFLPDPVILEIYPWLFSLSGRTDVPEPMAGYESTNDLAGDGLFQPGSIDEA